MEVKEQRVDIYHFRDGKCPYKDWFESIRDNKVKQRIDVRINRVRLGNFGNSKSVGKGVHELRIDIGPGYRIYFGRDGNQLVILLLGGDKSTQPNDIILAQNYWLDHKSQKKNAHD